MAHHPQDHTIRTVDELVAQLGTPTDLVLSKLADRLTAPTRLWVEASPFLCIASSNRKGACDVSPRGDPPGFVRILDDRTLLVPDRPGNRIADTLKNILDNPQVGLLFFVPGLDDSLRVNGAATLSTDPSLLAATEVEGKRAKLGIVVAIEEVYTQCAKAFMRAQLWDCSRFRERAEFPTNGEILRVLRGEAFDAAEYDRERKERYERREGFY